MELRHYLTAIRKGWAIVVAFVLAGAAISALLAFRATPIYAAKVSFFVHFASSQNSSDYSSDQLSQEKAVTYAQLLSSGAFADRVAAAPALRGSDVSADVLSKEITGSAALNTVLVNATIDDASPARAKAIATAVSTTFPGYVADLEGGTDSGVKLSVTNGPSVGSAPVAPRKTLYLAAGILAGLILGLLGAVARFLLDNAVRTAELAQQLVGAPALATIGFDAEAAKEPLLVHAGYHSARAEAFRRLRTNVQFLDASQPLQLIVVTSATDGEGKSTTAANLALAMAEAGSKVVLIEADLRRPKVSDYFDLERSVGLSNVLAGHVGVDDVLQPWGEHQLSVLTSGPLPPNPSELLGGASMHAMLADLREHFDAIVVDTPPLLPVTDAAVLANQADGVVVVVRSGKTTRGQVSAAMHALKTVDARIAGVVLNMKSLNRSDRKTYGTYGDQPSEWDAETPTPLAAVASERSDKVRPSAGRGLRPGLVDGAQRRRGDRRAG